MVTGEDFELDAAGVERAVAGVDPELIREHYVVIGRRRYPPQQVLAVVTGIDSGAMNTLLPAGLPIWPGSTAQMHQRRPSASPVPVRRRGWCRRC